MDVPDPVSLPVTGLHNQLSPDLLFSHHPLPMWVFDVETLAFLDVNLAATEAYGFAREEFLSMRISDIRPAEDVPRLLDALSTDRPHYWQGGVWRHCRKDGSVFLVEINTHRLMHQGRVAEFVMARDVTQRIAAENTNQALMDQLTREREHFSELLEHVPGMVWEFWTEPDPAARRANYVSSYVESLLGYPVNRWLSDREFYLSIIHPDDRDRVRAQVAQELQQGKGGVTQYRSIRADGSIAWLETRSTVVQNAWGQSIGMRGVTMDITERKRTEDALRESEERYRLVERATNDVIWDWDLVTDCIEHNDALYSGFGYKPEDVGNHLAWWYQRTHPEDREETLRSIREAIDSGGSFWTGEYRFARGDGEYVTVLDRSYVMRAENGKPLRLICSMLNITDRKHTEETLRFLADASQTLASSLDYETTLRNLVRLAVPFIADYCTLDMYEENGGVRRLAVAHTDPDKEAILREMQSRYYAGGPVTHPLINRMRTGDTPIVPVVPEDMLLTASHDAEHYEMFQALGPTSYMGVPLASHGKVLGGISFVMTHSGRRYSEADLTVGLEVARRAATAVDNARLYREIQRADVAKDEFLAMLSHELRNPLGAVSNALQLIRLRGKVDPSVQRSLNVMERQAKHMARLVDALLDVSRITQGKIELQLETVDVAALVEQAMQTVEPLLTSRRHVAHVSVPDEPVWLHVDPVRITQVLSNLLNNAAKYTDAGGHIWITANRAGADVEIRVRDTGMGIPAELLPHIFDLFAQADRALDRNQGGLGIGLTVVQSLVDLHGGSVSAWSEGTGRGSEFLVRLPATRPAPVHPPERRLGAAARRSKGLNILLVEDNVDAARTLSEIMRLWGHCVRLAHDGSAALDMAREQPADVLLLDIGLPGMDGYELVRALSADGIAPNAHRIALTGYGQAEDHRRSAEAGFHHHLVKPVDFDMLQNLLAELETRSEVHAAERAA